MADPGCSKVACGKAVTTGYLEQSGNAGLTDIPETSFYSKPKGWECFLIQADVRGQGHACS